VVDDQTVRVTLKQPSPPSFSGSLTRLEARVSAAHQKWGKTHAAPVGTGPFKFAEWVKSDRVLLERNDATGAGVLCWTRGGETVRGIRPGV